MALTVDQVFEKIGSFGRYQKLLLLGCNGLVFFWFGFAVLIMTFIAADPGWKCVANSTQCRFNGSMAASDKRRCDMNRSEWVFNDDLTSVATEFDLVCDKAIYVSIATSMIFLGFLLGGITVGPFADKLGRRITIYSYGCIIALCSLLSAFPHAYWLFVVFRFLVGFGVGGSSIGIYVLVTEMVGVRHRSLIGVSLWYCWTFSLLFLDLLAYFIRDWRTLALACGVPAIPVVLGWFITRESPRWLVLKGKVKRAEVILKRVSEVNGKEMPKEDLMEPEDQTRIGDVRDLFSSKLMARKTLLSWYIW
ncbi:solute carrier family 22 member 8-like [Pocillopora damicornis]|uniref:solute carrier family 22 member 8-like n=1 Tax=Pocillopora damicornis TaxID=46731 RepID=UPI000F559858|nr:solute carrier family 22 member 8-like [Pocillopora damicornis]